MTGMRATILLVVSQLLLLAATAHSLNATCGDGMVNSSDEECDDFNLENGDGCSNCTIEDGWCCGTAEPSDCAFVLFDLNENDGLNITDGNPVEVSTTSIQFLNMNEFIFCVGVPWDTIAVAIMELEEGDDTQESIGVNIASAIAGGRVENNSLYLQPNMIYQLSEFAEYEELEILLGQEILTGILITHGSLINDSNTELFADVIFNSLSYEVSVNTFFQPRNICIVVMAGIYNSSGCLNLSFIGFNDDRPVIIYVPESVAVLFEDHPDPVHVINGTIKVSDPDNPIYLLQSAEAKITPYNAENPSEVLYIPAEHVPEGLDVIYDPIYGTLMVSGNDTPQAYTQVFENLLYNNFMMEPLNVSRIIELTVNDGIHTSEVVDVIVVVINSNDIPKVVASANHLMVYYEGNGTVKFDPFIQVVDPDPNVMIMRLEVNLDGVRDPEFESISISTELIFGLTVTMNYSNIVINGSGTPDEYTQVLNTLVYTHGDSGHPTEGNRTLRFNVMDETTTNDTAYMFYVKPINDVPTLYFSTPSNTLKELMYAEDDPHLLLANDIVLQDVDTDIVLVTVELSGLLNKEHDVFSFNETLANEHGVDIVQTLTSDGVNGTVILNGSASAEQYEQILKSFTYINSFVNNSVINGVRVTSFYALDSMGGSSDMLTVYIDVTERNDEPDVQIDEVIQFTEGSTSIHIVTLHLIDIMDEELNSISKINVTLVATNGELDPSDVIFPQGIPGLPINNDVFNQLLVEQKGTPKEYEEVLRSIHYINQEDEPTFFANVTTKEILRREVIIALTDDNATHPSVAIHRIMINLTLINDNVPEIVINTIDTKCLAVPPMNSIQKRDVSTMAPFSAKFHRRRLQLKRKSAKDKGKLYAPKVLSAYAQHSSPENCLTNITVIFNSNTSVPPVEVQRDLEEVLFLEPSSLHAIPHHGQWLNHRTLVIKFDDCFSLQHADQVYIFFEEQNSSGSCDAIATCLTGVCYRNMSGCPLSGPVTVATNYTLPPASASPSPICDETGWDVTALGPYMIAAGILAVVISVIATVAYLNLSRNPRHTKFTHYQKLKPSKCQMKLCVETITSRVETNGCQAEFCPSKCLPSELPKAVTPDVEKPPHSIKINQNELKSRSNSKGLKKRKSISPSKEKKTKREDKEKKAKFQEEAKQSRKEGAEEVEDNFLECLTVINDAPPECNGEDKSTSMSAGVTTIGQFASTLEEGHQRLHPDITTLSEENEGGSSFTAVQRCQCRKQCKCASPIAQPQHTQSNSRQKQSVTTTPTKLDLQFRDKSHS